MKRRHFLYAGLLGLGILGTPIAAQAQAPIVMKMGTATINDSQHEWLKKFAATVDAESKGRIKVEIYPASQLGSSFRMIEQTSSTRSRASSGRRSS